MNRIIDFFLALAGLSFFSGVILFIIVLAAPNWWTNFYTTHFHTEIYQSRLKDNTEVLASCLLVSGVIIVLILEIVTNLKKKSI